MHHDQDDLNNIKIIDQSVLPTYFASNEAFVIRIRVVPRTTRVCFSIAIEESVRSYPVTFFLLPLRKVIEIDIGRAAIFIYIAKFTALRRLITKVSRSNSVLFM